MRPVDLVERSTENRQLAAARLEQAKGAVKRTSPTGESGSNADERNRTSTGFYSHKNLNLARLPVPPHPQGRLKMVAAPRDFAKPSDLGLGSA